MKDNNEQAVSYKFFAFSSLIFSCSSIKSHKSNHNLLRKFSNISYNLCLFISKKKKLEKHKQTIQQLESSEHNLRLEVTLKHQFLKLQSNFPATFQLQQQRLTISNLQEALVATKQELGELRQKCNQEVSVGWAARWLGTSKNNQNKSVHDI